MLNRRKFLTNSVAAITGGSLLAWLGSPVPAPAKAKSSDDKDTVTVIRFSDSGQKIGPVRVKKVHKTEDEWKQLLRPLQYQVTRQEGTERAFSGENDIRDKGLYRCICCGNAVCSSETNFHSGTGWPSFCATIAKENVRTETDTSL